MSTIVNDRDVLLRSGGRIDPGAGQAPVLFLAADSYMFKVSSGGISAPNSIGLVATMFNMSGAVSWSVTGASKVTPNGRTAALAYADVTDTSVVVTASVTYLGTTYTASATISKVTDGTGARGLSLSATSQVFQINKAGVNSPSSISLTATAQGLVGTPTWTITSGTAVLTAGGDASTKLLAFADMASDTVTVQVSQGGLTDTMTIAKVREGSDAVTGLLTNEAANVSADSAGNVASFTAAGGTFKVFDGLTDKTGNAAVTYSVPSTAGGLSITIAATGVYTVTGMTSDSGSATLRAVYKGLTIDKVYTLAKSKAGTNGSPGVTGQRGTVSVIATGYTAWSDTAANAAISSAGYGSPINRDQVTLTGTGFSQTRFYDSGSWLVLGAYFNGNLVVDGTLSCTKLSADTMTGQTYRTAAAGQRVSINETSNNKVLAYNSSGTVICEFGGTSNGHIASYAQNAGLLAALYGSNSGTFPAIYGTSTSASNLAAAGYFTASAGDGVQANSSTGNAIKIVGGSNGIVQGGGGGNFLFTINPASDNAHNLGSSSFRWANLYVASGVISTSDERTKIATDIDLGLAFINDLRPVKYLQRVAEQVVEQIPRAPTEEDPLPAPELRITPRAGTRYHYGLLAQQVRETMLAHGVDDAAFWTLADKDDPDSRQGLRYEQLIAVLVRATQELSSRLETLEANYSSTR